MFAIHRRTGGHSQTPLYQTQIKDGVTLSEGEAVQVSAGVLDKAASNSPVAGVYTLKDSRTGDDDAPVKGQWAPALYYTFRVSRGSLAASDLKPGASADLGTDAKSLAADSHHDVEVVSYDTERDGPEVRFKNPQPVV